MLKPKKRLGRMKRGIKLGRIAPMKGGAVASESECEDKKRGEGYQRS